MIDFMHLWPRPCFNAYISKCMCFSLNGPESVSLNLLWFSLEFSVHVNVLIDPLQPSRISYLFFLTRSIRCLLQMLRLYCIAAFVGSSVRMPSFRMTALPLGSIQQAVGTFFPPYFQAAKTDSQQMFSLKRKGLRSKMFKSLIIMPNQKGFDSLGQPKKHKHWL